ncbi:MAG: MBL fold metallo-hydrolase [Betaproteobacteria bacterium]|nr:MBL fold metallo-hydrolase [Betaproteobacteria bacterium]
MNATLHAAIGIGKEGGYVKRLMLLMVAMLLASCEIVAPRQEGVVTGKRDALVERAVAAMGGVEAMRALRSASIRGTLKHWEPEQSYAPGGEPRFAADASFDLTLDFANRRARTDWEKKFAYPAPRTFKYTEVVTPEAGFVLGVDSNVRNAASRKSNPPAHTMSSLRLTAAQRELLRVSPTLLLDAYDNPARVLRLAPQNIGGVAYPAVSYNAGPYFFIVMFDPQSGMPVRIRSQDFDNMWGDVNYDVVLSDWRNMAGVRVASMQRYELSGRMVGEVRLTHLSANPTLNPAGMSVPEHLRASAARPAAGYVPYQWVIHRQFIGVYLDSENPSYDSLVSPGLRFNELAPGVYHVVGGTHNSLLVEMRDHLIVFDAPVSDGQSAAVLRAAQTAFAKKPVRYLVLTHHHMDHAGGLRAYLAQSATLVVGRGASAHYRRVLAAPATRNPDLGSYDFSKVNIIEVSDRYVMRDGKREVSAHLIDNAHADSTLIGYVADARIGFVTDIWSPGAAALPRKITSPLAALVQATRRAGISPLIFAGGHGGTAEYAPLAGLAAKP